MRHLEIVGYFPLVKRLPGIVKTARLLRVTFCAETEITLRVEVVKSFRLKIERLFQAVSGKWQIAPAAIFCQWQRDADHRGGGNRSAAKSMSTINAGESVKKSEVKPPGL
jgi:hypothetical protein